MKKNLRKTVYIGLGLFILSILLQATILPGSSASAEVKQLSMGTATVGGIFHNIGSPLAQCVNQAQSEINITAEFTEGTTENLRLIGQKKMQLAIITPSIGNSARLGQKMFKDHPVDFRVVVRLLPNANIWATLAKSKIHGFADFKGQKIAVGPASGGLGVIARDQLQANGINYKKDITPMFMGAGDMAEALKDGAVEASFLTGELATMVASTHKIRLIPWEKQSLDDFLKTHPDYGEYTYPADYFKGVDYPVLTVDNGIQLICQTDMPDDLVYALTKAIIQNLDCMAKIYAPAKAITPEWAASELANPFHPGAIKYFKEIGIWKK